MTDFIIFWWSHIIFTDAQRILANPEQLLDEEDCDSKIKLRLFHEPIRELLVSTDKPLNARYIKNCFKKLGELEQCVQASDDRQQFVVTFSNSDGEWTELLSFLFSTSASLLQLMNTFLFKIVENWQY